MGDRIAAGADDMFRVAGQLWSATKDGEFPGLGVGDDVGSALVRRVRIRAALVLAHRLHISISTDFTDFIHLLN